MDKTFNPADNDYFISGSLDSKVRIWNIPDRHVMDWIDLHEMVTAVGYSNDGKLDFKEQVELRTKKKPQPRKITGFQFSTWNPSEVLVTSADSRVWILDGTKIVQKYKGFKNNNSQLSADYSPDGKYIISASEDSQVYVWRHEETKGKHKHPIVKSYEHFPCKEVSVTAPWPGSIKLEHPLVEIHSKKHSKKSTTTLPPPAAGFSPTHDDNGHSKRSSSPLPLTNSSTDNNDDIDHHANADSSLGPCESFNSAISSSGRLDDMHHLHPAPCHLPGGVATMVTRPSKQQLGAPRLEHFTVDSISGYAKSCATEIVVVVNTFQNVISLPELIVIHQNLIKLPKYHSVHAKKKKEKRKGNETCVKDSSR
ncbi:hypothetical protein L1987_77474 [Smallanthus sonchifolius]|uniref:Uncharacterized protein n=1 Tax=Smallanthus sonchifolius TaxID=185202 RepID=A0ACB8ZAA4_9ASTR|nr:hypothetical protein L1987_77474 [Smallanthus sonchifolius]